MSGQCEPAELMSDDFFRFAGRTGRVVSVQRPRTDYPYRTPATMWDVEFVATPDDDAPVERVRIPARAVVEVWT